jgi:hypothetical protein
VRENSANGCPSRNFSRGCLFRRLLRLKLAAMTPPLTFSPPITTDLCETAGQEFGHARIGMERALFEQDLVAQLSALVEALRAADIDRDRALAAFDTAAWSAWEAPSAPPAPEATFQEQSRPLGP